MKQPIEPEDIRVGDLVRAESKNDEYAWERRVATTVDAVAAWRYDWFLLDRPQPAPSKKAMVAAQELHAFHDKGQELLARRIDEAWAKEGLGGTDD